MDPLNYASVDLSIDVFDGGLATLVLNKPLNNYMLLNFSCFLTFLNNMNFYFPISMSFDDGSSELCFS
jgi:hypothetical protein